MGFLPDQIGSTFDIGLSTVDGSTVSVLDSAGVTQQLSTVAFMLSIDKQNVMSQKTDLDMKSKLTQLSSSALSDREFDDWPQASQGDWSGGRNQRVFKDDTKFWDGMGLVWPENDLVPQAPYVTAPVGNPYAVNPIESHFIGAVGGYMTGGGDGVAVAFRRTISGVPTSTLIFNSGNAQYPVSPSGFESNSIPEDMTIAGGYLWAIIVPANNSKIDLCCFQINQPAAMSLISTTTVTTTGTGDTGFGGLPGAKIAAGIVDNKLYVAVYYAHVISGGFESKITLFDFSTFASPSSITVTLPDSTSIPLSGGNQANITVNQMVFQGDTLLVSISDRQTSKILQYSIAGNSFSTLVDVPSGKAFITPFGSSLFIVGTDEVTGDQLMSSQIQKFSCHPYLFNGSLQDLGPLQVPGGFFAGVSRPAPMGPYAIWATYLDGFTIVLWAYDTQRDRMFRVYQRLYGLAFADPGAGTAARKELVGWPIAPLGAQYFAGPIARSTIGIAYEVIGATNGSDLAQLVSFGVFLDGVSTPVFGAVDITSSSFDFTLSDLPKLYREIYVEHYPLTPGLAVTIDVWFDQDPSLINPGSPDATVTHSYFIGDPLPNVTELFLGQLRRKLVYRMRSTAKPISASVRVSTGEVVEGVVLMSPNATVNGGGSGNYCFEAQGIDHIAARNWLRAIWRQRGGRMTVTLPDGAYTAVLQSYSFESPKPYSVEFRSDQPASMQQICRLKWREDG